jgi:hypothetical protein
MNHSSGQQRDFGSVLLFPAGMRFEPLIGCSVLTRYVEVRNRIYDIALETEPAEASPSKWLEPAKYKKQFFFGLTGVSHQLREEFAPIWFSRQKIQMPLGMVADYLEGISKSVAGLPGTKSGYQIWRTQACG